MDYANLSLFSVMKAKLNYLSERQAMLAQNVANADTPGYKAMDIAEPDFQKIAAGQGAMSATLKMSTTDPKHLGSGTEGSESLDSEKRKTTYELKPTGNNVVIEEEMAKISANQAEYQKVLNLYAKTVAMFKTAIGNPNTGG